jgi:hypothetical protein
MQSQTFPVSGNGHHAILIYAKDSAGNEMRKAFAFSIDDQKYPETSIWPSRGGIYASSVEVKLSPSEVCEWTKMTTDGSDPTEDHGIVYTGPISIRKTTRLKFRSKGQGGNLEPVRTAHFTITQRRDGVFESDQHIDGYIKANPDGTGACVGAFGNLGIGSGSDGKDNRAILHFDTASIPDNADIKHAYLEVTRASGSDDLWADGRVIQVDVQTGYFGTSQALQADDWGAPATAMGVAQVDPFTSDSTRSSPFSEAGLKAINKTGVTKIRLRLSSPHGSLNHYLFVRDGAAAKLFVEYEPAAAASP